MVGALTFLVLAVSLLHLFLFVYNRWLLCLTPSPMKPTSQIIWAALCVVLPLIGLLAFSGTDTVIRALNWRAGGNLTQMIQVMMLAVIAFFFTRALIWFQDRYLRERPRSLLDETVSRPLVPEVPSVLPRPLNAFDTTDDLRVIEREIAVSGMAPAFDGLTIVQIADVHFGQRLEMENYLRAVQELVQRQQADIVVLTGDLVDRRKDIVRGVEYHAGFRGRLGTLCVLGNHDYWTRPERILEELQKTHIRWLGGGERRTLKRQGRRLVFTGTDAPWNGEEPDFERLIRRETGDAVVLLSHTPDNAPRAARAGASLILSGHNHGGQMCLPVIGPIVVPSRYGLRYEGGLYRVGADSLLNVSRGIGVSSGGCRVLCPPEIVLLRLRPAVVDVMVGRVITAQTVFPKPDAIPGGLAVNERGRHYEG